MYNAFILNICFTVKLPDFLNATPMTDEKLNVLFKHLDTFIEFLEEHQEFFGEQNYIDAVKVEGESI